MLCDRVFVVTRMAVPQRAKRARDTANQPRARSRIEESPWLVIIMRAMRALRYVYILALVVWLGGMIVLGAIVAPATFQVLQASAPDIGRTLAGELFGVVLARFHYIAYSAAAVLLLTMAAMALLGPRPRGLAVRGILVAAMLAVAVYSGVVVTGRINAIQRDVGGLPSLRLPADDARRVRFDELHTLSTRLMMVNIVAALALLFWETGE